MQLRREDPLRLRVLVAQVEKRPLGARGDARDRRALEHRVWIVEGNLKEGQRHLYSKRRFYIDEDSWSAYAGEMYDGRGNRWRVQFTYGVPKLYDRKTGYNASYGAYDLLQGIYNVNTKPIPGKYKNGVSQSEKYFTPKGLSRGGVR